RERAPDAGGGEVDVLVAEQGAAVEQGAVVVAADGRGVHQVHAALLAGVNHQLAAFVVEDDGRDLHVEVSLPEPLGVVGAIVVLEQQRFGLRVGLEADNAVAVDAVLGVPAAVARAGVHDAGLADRRAGASPHAAAGGSPRSDFFGGEVVHISHVGIAAAAL